MCWAVIDEMFKLCDYITLLPYVCVWVYYCQGMYRKIEAYFVICAGNLKL